MLRFFRIRTRNGSSKGVILHLVAASALHLDRFAKRSFLGPLEVSDFRVGASLTSSYELVEADGLHVLASLAK